MGGRGSAAGARAGTLGGGAFANHGGAFTNHGGAFANHGGVHGNAHAMHGAKPTAGQHVALKHSTFRMAGTDHHHHHHHPHISRREPLYLDDFEANFPTGCEFMPNPYLDWNPCTGPSKADHDRRPNHRS
jgi:hypothetical protein